MIGGFVTFVLFENLRLEGGGGGGRFRMESAIFV